MQHTTLAVAAAMQHTTLAVAAAMKHTTLAVATAALLAGAAAAAAAPFTPVPGGLGAPLGDDHSGNMNGRYRVATGGKGPLPLGTFNDDYASKGHKYFDVWAPEIATHYGEVFWTDQHNQPLPADIVAKFKGKVIAITGYEQDQVMVSPQGQPGKNPGQDVSVPINWAYNHHYMMWATSDGYSELKQVDAAPGDVLAHGSPRKWVVKETPAAALRDDPSIPTSQMFSEGNGGESRKSFHGYPTGFAQLIESPTTWHITPMQIDTRNRDCGANPSDIGNCTQFIPGPEPKQAGLSVPAEGTNYSGLLECPCNSRFGGSEAIYGKDVAKNTKKLSHQYSTVSAPAGACAQHTAISRSAAACFAAVAGANVNDTTKNLTVTGSADYPFGCSVSLDADTRATTAVFNDAGSDTLSAAATCGASTTHMGQARSLIGVTLAVETDAAKGGPAMVPGDKGTFCSMNRKNVIGAPFVVAAANEQAAQAALAKCTKACMADDTCTACSVDCTHGDPAKCQFVALPKCGSLGHWNGLIVGDVTAKVKHSGVAKITMTGPADVWFGAGLNAQRMSDAPYTLIVNSSGVIEQQIGTCGSEAEHCPGDQLASSVTLLSNTVTSGKRTVVMTRPMVGATGKHYTFAPASQSTINFITAIGSSQVFAYHAAHMPSVLSLVAADKGAHTCVCDSGQHAQICDGDGDECDNFDKNCIAAPAASLLEQKNPTCNSEQYAGGLSCCHHGRIMLDADQEIRPELLRYHMKFRFWYEEYTPATATAPASHRNLPRIYQQTEADAGEYDVPPAFAKPGFPIPGYENWPANTPTPGTTCTGTCPDGPDCECVHEIHYKWKVGTEQEEHTPPGGDNDLYLMYAGGHCHAPSCISITLINNDTGEVLCDQLPIYGKGDVLNDKWDEAGYVTLPPCLWGDKGLDPPMRLPIGTNLLSIKKNRNTHVGHYGEMASWQMRGVYGWGNATDSL